MLAFIRSTPGCLSVGQVGHSYGRMRERGSQREENKLGEFKKLPKMDAKVEMHHVKFQKIERLYPAY